ncbi:glycosyltransferase [Photobacterium alginatilyticum]|uniref:Glycosyltransferase n=1 Tax=Photobacterium alginatilyticum TaxID=1775171 RepID=A0ABW9YRA0_9GAMM|nr:glycosyltransferase [Photobacterium alginatilyticum]NBI56021.1 glycosyltransferase [Photobacterium alginatilyticum]
MKKIGYVIPNSPALSESFIGIEIRAMMTLGHQVKPYAFDDKMLFHPIDAYLGFNCISLSDAPIYSLFKIWKAYRCHSFILKQQAMGYLPLLRKGLQLAYLAERDGCEHLHTHLSSHHAATAIVAAKILNIPISVVGSDAKSQSNSLQAADFICAITKEMQNELQLTTEQPIYHIPFGVYEDNYSSLVRAWRPHKDFLLVCQTDDEKELGTLIMALEQLSPEISIDIVGKPSLLSPFKKQLGNLALNHQISCIKNMTPNWYHQHASNYKALIMLSTASTYRNDDTHAFIIKEAMALGLPILASDLPIYIEILDSESGQLFPADDPHALAIAMESHLKRSESDLNLQRAYAFNRVMTLFTISHQVTLLSKNIEAL